MDNDHLRSCCRKAKDVSELLSLLGMECYLEAFESENIMDLKFFSRLNEGDLRGLGMKTGPRKKLLEALKILKEELAGKATGMNAEDSGELKMRLSCGSDSGIGGSAQSIMDTVDSQDHRSCDSAWDRNFVTEKTEVELQRCRNELNEKRCMLARTKKGLREAGAVTRMTADLAEPVSALRSKFENMNEEHLADLASNMLKALSPIVERYSVDMSTSASEISAFSSDDSKGAEEINISKSGRQVGFSSVIETIPENEPIDFKNETVAELPQEQVPKVRLSSQGRNSNSTFSAASVPPSPSACKRRSVMQPEAPRFVGRYSVPPPSFGVPPPANAIPSTGPTCVQNGIRMFHRPSMLSQAQAREDLSGYPSSRFAAPSAIRNSAGSVSNDTAYAAPQCVPASREFHYRNMRRANGQGDADFSSANFVVQRQFYPNTANTNCGIYRPAPLYSAESAASPNQVYSQFGRLRVNENDALPPIRKYTRSRTSNGAVHSVHPQQLYVPAVCARPPAPKFSEVRRTTQEPKFARMIEPESLSSGPKQSNVIAFDCRNSHPFAVRPPPAPPKLAVPEYQRQARRVENYPAVHAKWTSSEGEASLPHNGQYFVAASGKFLPRRLF